MFVTGHAKPGDTGTRLMLAHTAHRAKLDFGILHGCERVPPTSRTNCCNGLPDTTPAAIVHNASLPTQRHAVCTLGELQTTIAREGPSPSVIVVGDVM